MTDFQPGSVDYERQAADFSRGRALSAASQAAWRAAIEKYTAGLLPSRVLDLGSGTGRFSPLLAEWLRCRVVGVEPSSGMREASRRENERPSVDYVGGTATAIPFAEGSCDAAWLAFMVHHVPDRTQCARELVRVLRPGAPVLVAGAYSERRATISLFKYFPAALRVAQAFPKLPEIAAQFRAGGLELAFEDTVTGEVAASLREAAARTALRADSTLQLISDAEFAAGQRALEEAAAAESEPKPIIDSIDLLVFRAPPPVILSRSEESSPLE